LSTEADFAHGTKSGRQRLPQRGPPHRTYNRRAPGGMHLTRQRGTTVTVCKRRFQDVRGLTITAGAASSPSLCAAGRVQRPSIESHSAFNRRLAPGAVFAPGAGRSICDSAPLLSATGGRSDRLRPPRPHALQVFTARGHLAARGYLSHESFAHRRPRSVAEGIPSLRSSITTVSPMRYPPQRRSGQAHTARVTRFAQTFSFIVRHVVAHVLTVITWTRTLQVLSCWRDAPPPLLTLTGDRYMRLKRVRRAPAACIGSAAVTAGETRGARPTQRPIPPPDRATVRPTRRWSYAAVPTVPRGPGERHGAKIPSREGRRQRPRSRRQCHVAASRRPVISSAI